VETLLFLRPGDVSATGHFASLVLRPDFRTAPALTTFKNLFNQDSFIHSINHITQLNFECYILYGALAVTLSICYGALHIVAFFLLLFISIRPIITIFSIIISKVPAANKLKELIKWVRLGWEKNGHHIMKF